MKQQPYGYQECWKLEKHNWWTMDRKKVDSEIFRISNYLSKVWPSHPSWLMTEKNPVVFLFWAEIWIFLKISLMTWIDRLFDCHSLNDSESGQTLLRWAKNISIVFVFAANVVASFGGSWLPSVVGSYLVVGIATMFPHSVFVSPSTLCDINSEKKKSTKIPSYLWYKFYYINFILFDWLKWNF